MSELIARVERTIRARHLIEAGQRVLVAVSGGLDSCVLLSLLSQLARRHGWTLWVAHFNHQLRGRSSDADERFVKAAARRLRLRFLAGRADVKDFAAREKISLEMAARQLRHQFLAEAATRHRIHCLALAHHADDQIELFLLRLLRGAGGEGLAGMKWCNASPAQASVRLIRPLLDVPRRKLERFAEREKVAFREDKTNAELDFERNRIRHKLLPLLRRNFSRRFEETVLRSMEIIGAEAEFVGEAARAWLDHETRGPFDRLHLAVQRRVIQRQLLDREIVPDFGLIERLRVGAETTVAAASGRLLARSTEGLIRELPSGPAPRFDGRALRLSLADGAGKVQWCGRTISWRLRPRRESGRRLLTHKARWECFDAGRVGLKVHLRHWQPGDRFRPLGMPRSVKLQDWFVNQKVPRDRRHTLLLAKSEGGEIFWVEGLRIGDPFKVTARTRSVLEWRWSGEC